MDKRQNADVFPDVHLKEYSPGNWSVVSVIDGFIVTNFGCFKDKVEPPMSIILGPGLFTIITKSCFHC